MKHGKTQDKTLSTNVDIDKKRKILLALGALETLEDEFKKDDSKLYEAIIERLETLGQEPDDPIVH